MKNRILSVILTMLLVFNFMPLGGNAAEPGKTEAEDATAFVSAVLGYTAEESGVKQAETWIHGAQTYGSGNSADKAVTRAEFVSAMADLFKLPEKKETEYLFADVPPSNENASAIRQACELGWISKAEAFRPTNSITYPEVAKIAVVAMGYEEIAKAQGGYPTGYLSVAHKLGITDRLSFEEDITFTKAELMILIENMLNAKIAKIVGNGIMTTYNTEQTLMEVYYNIYKIKGVIDATKHSSLTSETAEFSRDMISINGENYYYGGFSDDLLGYNVIAYYHYNQELDRRSVVYLKLVENEVFEYSSEDYAGSTNGKLHFQDEFSTFSEKHILDNSYVIIYNGKKVTDKINLEKYLEDANGYIKLLDNDGDGYIDVLFIEDYKYIYVSEVDAETETIADFNSSANNVNLEETEYVIYDNSTMEEVGLEDIKIGSVIAAAMSKDKKVAKLLLCDEVLSGSPESYGSDGVVFNGVEYDDSAYYKKYYATAYGKYEPGAYYVGIRNDIVAYSAVGTNLTYGYGIQVASDTGFDAVVKIKVLNDYGKVKIYELAERVMIDGVWKDDDKCGVDKLVNTLFKYALSNGKIKYIDTPKELTLENMFEESSYDSMNFSDFPATANGRYRSTGMAFENAYYVSKAVIFMIDEDDVEYGSRVGNYNYLETAENYSGNTLFYDIDGAGFAGAVVTTKPFGSALGASASNGSVIQSVSRAYDEEGEECYKIKLMTYQGYLKTYYMSDDLMPKKSSGKILGFGDIVKTIVDTNDARILGVNVMFDGEAMSVEDEERFKESTISNNNYRYGMIYNYNNNQISYSNTQNFDGSYVFDLSTLRYQSVNTTNLVTIDRENKTIRKGYQDDFKSYRDYEDKASRVVVMYNYTSSSGVFIYEN
mgnify:CR=1 FL=1